MIYGETERLVLRQLEHGELPRFVEQIGSWDVVRWLSVVPFPYFMKDAENFYRDMSACDLQGEPQFYALAQKADNLLVGGFGLHPPRGDHARDGEIEFGYWLGKDYWGLGYMSEASPAVIDMAFARAGVRMVGATCALNNHASQKILAKAGMENMGECPRDYAALRGEDTVQRWLLKRKNWRRS